MVVLMFKHGSEGNGRMTTVNGWTDYEERLGRVTAHIYDHLDKEIDLRRLADIACLSPYHWHRIHNALYGETIVATVKRLRLHRAAGYLVQTMMPIEQVAASPRHEAKPAPMDIAGMKAGQVMLVPSPAIVDAFIRRIPRGTSMDVRTLRHRLARRYRADVTCPIALGFHLRTVAEAACEAHAQGTPLSQVTPVWRVLDATTPTTGRLSCGPGFILDQRRREGL